MRKRIITLEINEMLSKNLSLKEAISSPTAIRKGIDNLPSFEQLTVIKHLAVNLFQPIRDHFNRSIKVNSFYRSPRLNKLIGGSTTSDHMVLNDIAAIDIDDIFCQKHGIYNRDIFEFIYNNLDYNNLIWEFNDIATPAGLPSPRWVHISYSIDPEKNKIKNTYYTNGDGYVPFKEMRKSLLFD